MRFIIFLLTFFTLLLPSSGFSQGAKSATEGDKFSTIKLMSTRVDTVEVNGKRLPGGGCSYTIKFAGERGHEAVDGNAATCTTKLIRYFNDDETSSTLKRGFLDMGAIKLEQRRSRSLSALFNG